MCGGGGNVNNGKLNNLSDGAAVVWFGVIDNCFVAILSTPKYEKKKANDSN